MMPSSQYRKSYCGDKIISISTKRFLVLVGCYPYIETNPMVITLEKRPFHDWFFAHRSNWMKKKNAQNTAIVSMGFELWVKSCQQNVRSFTVWNPIVQLTKNCFETVVTSLLLNLFIERCFHIMMIPLNWHGLLKSFCLTIVVVERHSRGLILYWFPGPWFSLTHWGRVTHICVGKVIILGSDNGLSPGRRQAII